MKSEAFWINSADSQVYNVGTYSRHIIFMWENLELFGLDEKTFKDFYRKARERLPPVGLSLEGNGREFAMKWAIQRGWIRVRFVPRNYCFTLEYGGRTPNRRQRDAIWTWAMLMTGHKVGTQKPLDKVSPTSVSVILQSVDDGGDYWHMQDMTEITKMKHELFTEDFGKNTPLILKQKLMLVRQKVLAEQLQQKNLKEFEAEIEATLS